MNPRVRAAKEGLIRLEAQAEMNAKELAAAEAQLLQQRSHRTKLAMVRETLMTVARVKREETTNKMEALVTAGLQSVLEEPTVALRVQEKQTKKQLSYQFAMAGRGYVSEDIRAEKGGGVQNLVSFLLTVVLTLMLAPKRTRFFAFDEKFAHLSRNHLDATGRLLRELARRLGCQFLLVSHQPEMDEHADVLCEMTQDRRGVTALQRVR